MICNEKPASLNQTFKEVFFYPAQLFARFLSILDLRGTYDDDLPLLKSMQTQIAYNNMVQRLATLRLLEHSPKNAQFTLSRYIKNFSQMISMLHMER